MKNNGAKNESRRRRFTFALCHEVAHYIVLEQQTRRRLGLPHDKLIDVVEDWLLAMGQARGFPPPGPTPPIARYATLEEAQKYGVDTGEQKTPEPLAEE